MSFFIPFKMIVFIYLNLLMLTIGNVHGFMTLITKPSIFPPSLHRLVNGLEEGLPILSNTKSFTSARNNVNNIHQAKRDHSSFESLDSSHVNGSRKDIQNGDVRINQLILSQHEISSKAKELPTTKTLSDESSGSGFIGGVVEKKLESDQDSEVEKRHSYWSQLYQMMRPGNFPGVVLFHLIGIHRSLSTLLQDIPNTYTFNLFLQTATQPTISATLLALLLIVSSSMLVNDYYDTRSGVDVSLSTKPLASGDVPLPIAKKVLSIMYGVLFMIVATLPGTPTRLLVAMGTMMTFYYTKYLKPRTWWKNIVCAMLMSLAPLTSGYATLSHPFVLRVAQANDRVIDLLMNWKALGPLFCSLFCGFMGREMIMDIKDCQEDRDAGIRSVPVMFGIEAATKIVLMFWIGTGLFSVINPLLDFLSASSSMGAGIISSLFAMSGQSLRRLSLALIGSSWLIIRATQLVLTKGKDEKLIMNAIEEAKLNVLFILAASI